MARPFTPLRPAAKTFAAAALAAALALPLHPPAARAADQTDSAVFDLQLKGIRAGSLSVSGAVRGTNYVATGQLKSSGLLAIVKKIAYDAKAQGTVTATAFTPARYEENADTGRRQSEAVMDYVAGVPQLKVYNPPRKAKEQDIDPATQGGTVDPLTAAFATLRDVPAAEACKLKLTLFDGKRRSQVTVGNPVQTGAGLTCTGEYRRLAGFSKKDMAEKVSFPFTVTYEPAGDGMLRVTEVSMDTLYGKGYLKRR